MSKPIIEQLGGSNIKLISEAREQAGKRYLGTLKGVGADLAGATRNGRAYTKKLWENVLSSDEFKEGMETRTIYGELGHPAERLETLPERVAIVLTDAEFKGDDLITTFDILDTPMGQIVKSLVDYGSKLGISSRGGGETYVREGKEFVNEDTYKFEAFDIVLLPAVKSARLNLTESQDNKLKVLREGVERAIESAEDKEALKGALKNIKSPEIESIIDSLETNQEDDVEAESDRSNLLNDLQESIQKGIALEEENAELRDKVTAVSNREAKLTEELEKVKAAVRRLSKKSQQTTIQESKLVESEKSLQDLKEKYDKLQSKYLSEKEERETISKTLTESKKLNEDSIVTYRQENEILKEALKNNKEELQSEIDSLYKLNESLKKDKALEKNRIERKLNEAIEVGKRIHENLKESLGAYIEVVCRQRGLDSKDVYKRLSENYTVQEVNEVIERLSDYKMRIDSLPFATSKVSATFKGSKEPIFESKQSIDEDKQASPELLKMLGFK